MLGNLPILYRVENKYQANVVWPPSWFGWHLSVVIWESCRAVDDNLLWQKLLQKSVVMAKVITTGKYELTDVSKNKIKAKQHRPDTYFPPCINSSFIAGRIRNDWKKVLERYLFKISAYEPHLYHKSTHVVVHLRWYNTTN
jgi:hypothetical protein